MDYYAELELSPDATADEIKRQYKKLALQYHPDRHPGKEAEVVPRFQVSRQTATTDPVRPCTTDDSRSLRHRCSDTGPSMPELYVFKCADSLDIGYRHSA